MIEYAWLIPLFPLAAFGLIAFGTKPWKQLSGYVAVAGILASLAIALAVFGEALSGARLERQFDWLPLANAIGQPIALPLGILVDPLTAIMLVVVTSVSSLVIVYSQGYMHGDPGYSRYFAFISLFCMSMLGLVLANNLLALYIFWELVGLCSYLLIGFWYQKPEAAAAAKKAFIVTRLGDIGLLIGILLLFSQAGTLEFTQIEEMVAAGRFDPTFMSLVGILIFCGAVGKSAQFPLHVWLPDAMEGPTPVSALIHAATMVAAGVYLVARTFPIFEAGPLALTVVMAIGTFTALFAATMAMVSNDIKRVMAYSTISQLGYMMLALGVGARTAAVFHLMNHAFFKALLFLAAGSVIHALGTQDLRQMGGLKDRMKITSWTMLIAALSLSGFPLLTSGFWSKDEIMAAAYTRGEYLAFAVALFTAFLTAFYMFRAWFLAFWGTPRWDAQTAAAASATQGHSDAEPKNSPLPAGEGQGEGSPLVVSQVSPRPENDPTPQPSPTSWREGADVSPSPRGGGGRGAGSVHPVHESPWVMAAPLIALAVPSLLIGFWGSPLMGNGFAAFLEGHPEEIHLEPVVMLGSTLVALGGIWLAWLMYGERSISAEKLTTRFAPIYQLLVHKYWIDELYNAVVRYGVLGSAQLLRLFDNRVLDGAVNGVGALTRSAGSSLRQLQTGRLQSYAWLMYAGAILIAAVTLATQYAR